MDLRCPEAAWLAFTAEMLDAPLRVLPVERVAVQMTATLPSGACAFCNGGGGATHHVAISLAPAETGHTAFVLGRCGPYTVEELQLAATVQRLLIGIVSQLALPLDAVDDPQPVAACGPMLTPRESAVLSLVANGMTAVAAGRRLGIAERTVHKHLERSYAKLRVSDRVSAVLSARRLGMID
jgi:DNA-binding CsgD family transcriptional regulator